MNSPCLEQARLSREATAAQKKYERPLKPQAVKPSASTFCLQRVTTSGGHWSPKETRAGHCSLNNHSHLQPPENDWKLITSRPLLPHFIRDKAIQVNKTKTKLVTIDKTKKMIQFILRCQRTAPPCVIWYWHSETLRLDAPATKHVHKNKSMQTNKTNYVVKGFFSDSFTQIVAEQINK